MNKLIVALCASAFAFGSVSALAGSDLKPLSKMETEQAKAAKVAAAKAADEAAKKAGADAAAKKAARQKKLSDATAMDIVATENMTYDTKQGAADAKASKAQPAPTKAERAQYSKEIDKKTGQ